MLDTLIPALCGWGERDDLTMAKKSYSEEFRRQAVDLYETTPGATVRGIAQDLGVSRGTLRGWLHRWGTGRKTGPDGAPAPSPLKPNSKTGTAPPAQAGADGALAQAGESVEERVARLEAENAALRAERAKLTREREILQQAAKYFAGETNW